MNDRVSNRPPSMFVSEDEAMDRHTSDEQQEDFRATRSIKPLPARAAASSLSVTRPVADKEVARRSGIFRFGKSLAAAFHPVSFWDDLKHKRKHNLDDSQSQNDILKERRKRAERIYAEMKQSGQLAGLATTTHLPDNVFEPRQYGRARKGCPPDRVRDSMDLDTNHSSKAYEGDADGWEHLAPPVPLKDPARMDHYISDEKTDRRSSFTLRNASFSSLKKVKSEFHLGTPQHRAPLRSLQPVTVDKEETTGETNQLIRKQISRKDLQRQQKLSKKVSNLEGKLKAARQELDEVKGASFSTRPPQRYSHHKKAFVPGALPSLPSERRLLPENHDGAQTPPGLPSALREMEHGSAEVAAITFNPWQLSSDEVVDQGRDERRQEVVGRSTSRKRKSSSEIKHEWQHRSDQEEDSPANGDATGAPVTRQERPTKSQKRDEGDHAGLTPDRKIRSTVEPTKGPEMPIRSTTEVTAITYPSGPTYLSRPMSSSTSPRKSTSTTGKPTMPCAATMPDTARHSPVLSLLEQDTLAPLPKIPNGLDRIARLVSKDLEREVMTTPRPKTVRDDTGGRRARRRGNEAEDFEWPDDVF